MHATRWLLFVLLLPGSLHGAEVPITLLHLNDVYEITRPGRRDLGGLTRVASLLKELRGRNPNTLSILAGDFLSPSALGTARVDGQRLDGRHMVDVLNTLGLDLATFGNHEFDLKEPPFLARLEQMRFRLVSGNVTNALGKPFPGVERLLVRALPASGAARAVRIGFLGLTVSTGVGGKGPYWRCHDFLETAQRQVKELRQQHGADLVVAITHLNLEEDIRLAREVPGIDLILGGHEHENNTWRAPGLPPIFKADANVRTVWVHQLRYDLDRRTLAMESQLRAITGLLPEDPATVRVVDRWIDRGFTALKQTTGRDPREVVAVTTNDLEGREVYVRRGPTNLTRLIADALQAAVPEADLAVYNSGMIRIDDLIPPGPLTWYDVLRILPYGGEVMSARIQGSRLRTLFDRGLAREMIDDGGFLQTAGVVRGKAPGEWQIAGKPLDTDRFYRVAINDYLLAGREVRLAFLGQKTDEVTDVHRAGDVREAVVAGLHRVYPREEPSERKEAQEEKARSGGYFVVIPWTVAGVLLLVLLVQFVRALRQRLRTG